MIPSVVAEGQNNQWILFQLDDVLVQIDKEASGYSIKRAGDSM